MKSYKAEEVINGTWGEAWCNGVYLAQIQSMEAKVSFKTADIDMCRQLAKKTKVVGYEGKGTLKLNKVTSEMIILLNDNMKKGKQTVCTIISKLDDPSGLGCERVAIKDACFEELTLIDWEAKKNGEESIPFTFSEWELLDVIEV
ncbi:MAG: phage tail tube protein [Sarcina sp.]